MMDPIPRHLDELRRRNRRPSTITQRRYALVRLQAFLSPRPLLGADHDALVAWIFDQRALSAESQATEISHLRGFYRWALEAELVAVDPMARIRRPMLHRRLPRPIDYDDLVAAVHSAPLRIRPWLLLAGWAGLRCGEIAPLRAEDLWWRQEPPLIVVSVSKGGDTSSVPISSWLAVELARCDLPARGWLFRRLDGRRGPVPAHLVSQLGNRYLRSIGVPATMHQLRHWYGTEVLRASGGNVRVAQEALRHASITSTQLYTFVTPVEVADALGRLPHPDAA